jgi:cytochrome c-type biogenesis protein CcmE
VKPAAWFGLIIILGALAFGAKAFVTNLAPYLTFEQARKSPGSVQVMGTLDKTSITQDAKALNFTIIAKDNSGERMNVIFTAAKPANFQEAIEVTAIGKWDGTEQVFRAQKLLVKCPTKYQGTETETKEYGTTP